MNIQLHKNVRTPPAIRLELQSQPESVSDREGAELPGSHAARGNQKDRVGCHLLRHPPEGEGVV